MRQSVPGGSKDVVAHGDSEWNPLTEPAVQSITDEVLVVKGMQSFFATMGNSAAVVDGREYMVTLHILSVDAGQVRMELGDAVTPWYSEAGMHSHKLVADGTAIKVVGNTFFKGQVNLKKISVR